MDAGLDCVDAALSLSLDPRPLPLLAPAATVALLEASSPLLPRLCFPPAEAASESGGGEAPEYDGSDPAGYLVTAGGLRPVLATTLMDSKCLHLACSACPCRCYPLPMQYHSSLDLTGLPSS